MVQGSRATPRSDLSNRVTDPTRQDTVWFGGLDEVTGFAVEGGSWDFDTAPLGIGGLQGWTSEDRSLDRFGLRFARVSADDFAEALSSISW